MASLEQLLDGHRQVGRLDSHGSWTLGVEQARRKFAQHGLSDPTLWTLKWVQVFQGLGCSALEVRLRGASWELRGRSPQRGLNTGEFSETLACTALSGSESPEKSLAMSLLGLSSWAIASVGYAYGQVSQEDLLDSRSAIVTELSPANELVLRIRFATRPFPRFPISLWRRSLVYCPMAVTLAGQLLNRCGGADRFFAGRPEGPYWLESIHCGADPGLPLNPTGRADVEMDLALNSGIKHAAVSSRLRWVCPLSPDGSAMSVHTVILIRPLISRRALAETTFHPVSGGIPLMPFALVGFPRGLEVVFRADDLPTDFTSFRLREGPELVGRLTELAELVQSTVSKLLDCQNLADRVLRSQRPRRNLALDAWGILTGCSGVTLAIPDLRDISGLWVFQGACLVSGLLCALASSNKTAWQALKCDYSSALLQQLKDLERWQARGRPILEFRDPVAHKGPIGSNDCHFARLTASALEPLQP